MKTEWTMHQWRTEVHTYHVEISNIRDVTTLSDEHTELIAQAIRDFRDSKEDHMEHVGFNMPHGPVLGVMMPNRHARVAAEYMPKKETVDG